MTQDEIYTLIVEKLHTTFQLDPSRITLDANLYADLDIDSIDAVDLAVKLQRITGKRITPETFKSVRTVRDLVNAVGVLLRTEVSNRDRPVAPTLS
jgi:acyl carrier protein